MFEKVKELIAANSKEIFLIITTAIATLLFTKGVPAIWRGLKHLFAWLGGRIGGTLSHRLFQHQYLDWLVTDLQELRLTGIVSAEDSKRPKLEQVYLSLRLDKTTETQASPSTRGPVFANRYGVATWEDAAELLSIYRDCHSHLHNTTPAAAIEHTLTIAQKLSNGKKGTFRLRHERPIRDETIRRDEEHSVRQWLSAHNSALESAFGDFQLRRLIKQNNRIAILGGPGAGKSTLLQHIALTYARERAGDSKLRRKGSLNKVLGSTSWRVPIFIRLSSVASQLAARSAEKPDPSILDVLTTTLPPDLQAFPEAKNYFSNQLKKGACAVLLDGLDEVPSDQEFAAVTRAIQSMAVRYPENIYIVTSRVAGWRTGVGTDFAVSYVEDLSDAQIETFVYTWYSAVERNAVAGRIEDESPSEQKARERRATQNSLNLKHALQTNIGIRRLATNPMLLSIIAVVHRSLATLPKERSKLYNQCTQILLEQWDISRGLRVDDTGLRLEQKQLIMRRLAHALHTGEIGDKSGGREAKVEQFERIISDLLPGLGKSPETARHLLRRLLERSGLLIERSRGSISFAHHTFQEYFTAQYFADAGVETGTAFLTHPDRILSDWWREVALLFSGLLPDSSVFVRSVDRPDLEDIFLQKTRMAALCASESVTLSDDGVRSAIVQQALRVRQATESSAIPRTDAIADYVLRWAKSPEWLFQAAMLRQTSEPKIFSAQASSLATTDTANKLSAEMKHALIRCLREGKRIVFSESILSLLGGVAMDDDHSLRMLALQALGRHEFDQLRTERVAILVPMLENADSALVQGAAAALGELLASTPPTPALVTGLRKLLIEAPAQGNAAFRTILEKTKIDNLRNTVLDSTTIQSLMTMAAMRGDERTLGAIEAIGLIPRNSEHRESVLDLALMRIGDSDASIHMAACGTVARLASDGSSKQAISFLMSGLQAKSNASQVANHLEALSFLSPRTGSPEQWNILEECLRAESRRIKVLALRATQTLRPPGSSNGGKVMKTLLRDRSMEIRLTALHSLVRLGLINSQDAEEPIIEFLRGRSVGGRLIAVRTARVLSASKPSSRLCSAIQSLLIQETDNLIHPNLGMSIRRVLGRSPLGGLSFRIWFCGALADLYIENVVREKSVDGFAEMLKFCGKNAWILTASAAMPLLIAETVESMDPIVADFIRSEFGSLLDGQTDEQFNADSAAASYFDMALFGPSDALVKPNMESAPPLLRRLRKLASELPPDAVASICRDALLQDDPFAKIISTAILASMPYAINSAIVELLRDTARERDKRIGIFACAAIGSYAKGTQDSVLSEVLQERLGDAEPAIQEAAWDALSSLYAINTSTRGQRRGRPK